jgi:hypothetical protein
MTKNYVLHRFMATAACAAVVLMGTLAGSMRAHAEDGEGDGNGNDPRVRRGLQISPVPLNLKGKNRQLVGLGSYLVNAVASCNDCHSADPSTQYAPGGNPFFKGNPPTVVNQATFLGGGRNFGALIPGTPEIISRNLTPDRTGLPEGGRSFAEFLHIFRTGADLDHLHPNCSATVTTNCFPPNQPFNGDLLQIMPWPVYQNMTERDVRAIYEYLRAIPCIAGPPTGVLHNDCT